jgi:hypothetical protein
MDRIYSAIIQFVSLAASFFSIFTFFKIKKTVRIFCLIFGIAAALGLSTYSFIFNENRIESIKRTSLVSDAKILDNSIIITGWEKDGDYLGYLVQLSSFYSKHKDYYPNEAPAYAQYVSEWSEFFRQRRMNDSFISSSQISVLEGLVKAGKSNIESIIQNNQK